MDRSVRRGLLAAATVTTTTAAMLLAGVTSAGAAPAPADLGDPGFVMHVPLGANLSFPTGQQLGTPQKTSQNPEFPPNSETDGAQQEGGASDNALSLAGVPIVTATPVAGSPGLTKSFQGINGFQERFANNGNQFSFEPPDQGLCAGNGLVFEGVNDAVRVYNPNGSAASPVTDMNTFFGYPPVIDRTKNPPRFGPEPTDPTCLFDAGTQRWFVTILTLEVNARTGALTGKDHIDIAVSKTANPLNGFAIYRLPVQDDGSQGTPSHNGCPCIGDYPHIATDANGFYVTTNEYPFSNAPGIFGNNFNGAQIYAFDKAAMAARRASVTVVQFSHTQLHQNGHVVPGFTLAPAQVPGAAYNTANGGTQYFLDSVAGEEAQPGGFTGQAASVGVYQLTNTQSLRNANPNLTLSGALRPSEQYVQPPLARQKAGNTPLANLCTVIDCFGFGPAQETEGPIATNDTRMLQVYWAHGMLYGALDTGVQVGGQLHAGIAWFLVNPGASPDVSNVAHQGYIGVAGQDVMFPAVAALSNGNGAMAFSLSGPLYYPTAAYALLTPTGVTGSVHVAAAGVGPQDGFTEYEPAVPGVGSSAPRPRWGDYGAAVPVGSSIWLASEYIGQTCGFAEFQRDPTCGQTRGLNLNWATRISAVTP